MWSVRTVLNKTKEIDSIPKKIVNVSKLIHLQNIRKNQDIGESTGNNNNNNNNSSNNMVGVNKTDEDFELPPAPDNCCMSGCANCVWITYADELTRMFHDGGTTAKSIILKKMNDPNMRAFLSTEISLSLKKDH